MAAKNFLAFDLGAESGRAILGTLDNGRLTLAEKHRFANPNGRMLGHYHWNLLGQWQEIKTGLTKAAGQGIEIAGMGVDTWGVDFGLLDAAGGILGNPFMYRDSRTDGMMEKAFARVGKERIFQATGLQFMQINSLYQLLAMRESRSPLLDIASALLFMPDLFNYLLSGQKVNEFSIASTSQMFDPRKRAWATELLDALDLPARLLQRIVPSGAVLGPLRKEVAQECGVGQIPVIAPGCHDTASAVAAVPTDAADSAASALTGGSSVDPTDSAGGGTGGTPDWCYISSGTWSLMGVELPEPIINDKSIKYNYTNEGGVGGRIRFLKNIMGLWLVQECRRAWQKEGHDYNYAELTRAASEAKPFVALVDPDHAPFLTPGDMPGKIARFCQKTRQPAPANHAQFVRLVLESLALTYRRTIEGLEDILGRRMKVIHIVGGGCQNELLNQMTADACGRPVIAGPVEATAVGNILTQAMAVGEAKSLAEVRSIVRASFDVKRYEPREPAAWDRAYTRYQEILGQG